MNNYKHLNKETQKIMILSVDEKIDWVRQEHFVSYPSARKILREACLKISLS